MGASVDRGGDGVAGNKKDPEEPENVLVVTSSPNMFLIGSHTGASRGASGTSLSSRPLVGSALGLGGKGGIGVSFCLSLILVWFDLPFLSSSFPEVD